MFGNRKTCFAAVLLLSGVQVAQSSSFSFSGTFNQDSGVQLFTFSLSAASTATIKTWSYGGGTDALGQPIAAGGFATDLALYSGTGTLIDFTNAGSCPPQNIDPASGLCGDAILQKTNLAAGNYIVALTEYFNIPNGLTLASGFLEDGQGNFTGPFLCGTQGGFFDAGCNKRTQRFEVDILGANSAAAVPEPVNTLLLGSGLLAVIEGIRRRHKLFNN